MFQDENCSLFWPPTKYCTKRPWNFNRDVSGQVKNANALTGEPLETKEEIETEDNEDAEAEGHRSQG